MIRRNIELPVGEPLAAAPVILVNGARQTGKTTLVRALNSDMPKATYATLDDPAVRAVAAADPAGLVKWLAGAIT